MQILQFDGMRRGLKIRPRLGGDFSVGLVATYEYDPWGKLLAVKDADGNAITSSGHAAIKNPLRYRGYYYDSDSGFYYLQSRYYDPQIGRFINVDSYVSTGQGLLGCNMFAYCSNNPITKSDSTGDFWLTATICGIAVWKICAVIVAAVGAAMITNAAIKSISTSASSSYPRYPTQAAKAKAVSKAKEEEVVIAAGGSHSTRIYRYGKSNPGNLTPKQKDAATGLSFSLIPPPPGVPAVETTIEMVNSTGVLLAIQDHPGHVSIIPLGGTMQDWIDIGSNSIWTTTLKSIVVRWEGE